MKCLITIKYKIMTRRQEYLTEKLKLTIETMAYPNRSRQNYHSCWYAKNTTITKAESEGT
jgi:hypothetical protein